MYMIIVLLFIYMYIIIIYINRSIIGYKFIFNNLTNYLLSQLKVL